MPASFLSQDLQRHSSLVTESITVSLLPTEGQRNPFTKGPIESDQYLQSVFMRKWDRRIKTLELRIVIADIYSQPMKPCGFFQQS